MSILESEAIDLIHRVGGDPLVKQIVASFLKRGRERITGMRDGIRSLNRDEVAYWAHSMRSGALLIGADELAAHAERIEMAAADADQSALQPLLDRMTECFGNVEKELETI